MNELEQYYAENFDKLVKRFSGRCGGPQNAEDVVQEGFERALRYIDSLEPGKEIGPWLNRILNNALRDLQKDHRRLGMSVEWDEEMHETVDLSQFNKARVREIINIIRNKRDGTRRMLELYFIHRYTPRNICQVLDVSNKAVRNCIWRFKQEMRAL